MSADGPKGYVLRGKGLPKEGKTWSCPLCPERACLCASAAWAASKRLARFGVSVITISTVGGVLLATTKPAGEGHFSLNPTKGRKRRAAGTGEVIEEADGLVEEAPLDAGRDDVDEEPEEVSLEELAEQEAEDES